MAGRSIHHGIVAWVWVIALLTGCVAREADQPVVIVYTAHDALFSEPILDRFQQTTGIVARAKFDVESTKTVGLTNAIMAEAARPRCDVFWNNEILNTLRLKKQGLLEAYMSPPAADFPASYRDREGHWYGFAARARILICNTELVSDQEKPRSILDLTDSRWKGRAGIAKPLFGTTATHAACLFAFWGETRAKDYFRDLKRNGVHILAGNKRVADAVAGGRLAFGLTDTDDALHMIDQGFPVEIIYPDQEPDAMGTLFIPNTVAVIRGGPNPDAARKLVDYLLSPAVEESLARGPSGQIPLNPQVNVATRVESPRTIRAMEVDFDQAADQWAAAAAFIEAEFASN